MTKLLSALCFFIILCPPSALAQKKSSKPGKITYRTVSTFSGYDKTSRGQHLNIKVTPPKVAGPDEWVFVEIYNFSKANLGLVMFDITLQNNRGYDLSTEISGEDLLPGRSALRKLPVRGKGPFPPIVRVRIDNLRILNANASTVRINTYVDLLRRKGK